MCRAATWLTIASQGPRRSGSVPDKAIGASGRCFTFAPEVRIYRQTTPAGHSVDLNQGEHVLVPIVCMRWYRVGPESPDKKGGVLSWNSSRWIVVSFSSFGFCWDGYSCTPEFRKCCRRTSVRRSFWPI